MIYPFTTALLPMCLLDIEAANTIGLSFFALWVVRWSIISSIRSIRQSLLGKTSFEDQSP